MTTGKALDWLFRSIAAGHADSEGTILRWVAESQSRGKGGPAREVLERGARSYPSSEPLNRELGLLRFKSKGCPGVYEAVSRFETGRPNAETLNAIALFETRLGRRDQAVALFQRSLALRPDQPGVLPSLNLLQKGLPSGH